MRFTSGPWLLGIVGVLMITAGVILWNVGEGFAALAFMIALVLFGGLTVLAGVVLLVVRSGRRNG